MAASVGLRREGVLCLGCALGPRHACTCGYVDDRDPRVIRIEDHLDEPDEFWYSHKRPQNVRGTLIEVADTIRTGVRDWGRGIGVPVATAKMRSMAMALSRVTPCFWGSSVARLFSCALRDRSGVGVVSSSELRVKNYQMWCDMIDGSALLGPKSMLTNCEMLLALVGASPCASAQSSN